MQAKGIEATVDSLREEYEFKNESNGMGDMSGDDYDTDEYEDDHAARDDTDEIIDVVGEEEVSVSSESCEHADSDQKPDERQVKNTPCNSPASFSIESILSPVVKDSAASNSTRSYQNVISIC